MSLLTLAPDTLLVVFNDMPEGRSLLSLATSTDGGDTWRRVVVFETAPTASFHYPTAHLLPDRDLVVVIYSVDVLPDATAYAGSRLIRGLRGLHMYDNYYEKEGLGMQPQLNSTKTLFSGSGREFEDVGAWGRVSLGMRLALLSASQLVHAAHSDAFRLEQVYWDVV